MSTSNEIDPSPYSSSSFFFSSASKVSDVSKYVGEELDKVEESFEAARLIMEQVFLQINEARVKLNNLLIMQDQHHQKKQQLLSERGQGGGGGGGDEYQSSQTEDHLRLSLKELNDKVSHFKSLIPSSLLVVKKEENPPSESSSSKSSNPPPPRRRRCLEAPPSPPYKNPSIGFMDKPDFTQHSSLSFLLAFPENTVIKKSLLRGFIQTVGSRAKPRSILRPCCDHSIIYKVYKKDKRSVAGYWVNPLARTSLEKRLTSVDPNNLIHITGNIDNEEFTYSDPPIQFLDSPSARDVIDGRRRWEKSSAIWAEIDDLHLSFTSVSYYYCVKYLSLSGNSTMKELPECITKLDSLQTLDLEDCQNLVVIPSKIANLRRLTRLDMSGCHSLVHMPSALAQLYKLTVLKGFVINTQTNNIIKEDTATTTTCTLKDLARELRGLRKLKISTNVKGFPNGSDLALLDKLELRKLTISWEGYSTTTSIPPSADHSNTSQGDNNNKTQIFHLKKLDLRCAPSGISYTWLTPFSFPLLKKLYIIGGQLDDLRQKPQDDEKISNGSNHHAKEDEWTFHPARDTAGVKADQWFVRTLRLKYLNKLKIDWNDVKLFFPTASHLQTVDCPNLSSIPEDDYIYPW